MKSDYLQSENTDVLCRTLTLTSNMVHAAGEEFSKPRQHRFFKILLQIGSNPQMKHMQGLVDNGLDMLARNCKLEDTSDLFSIELSSMLDELKDDFEDWDKETP